MMQQERRMILTEEDEEEEEEQQATISSDAEEENHQLLEEISSEDEDDNSDNDCDVSLIDEDLLTQNNHDNRVEELSIMESKLSPVVICTSNKHSEESFQIDEDDLESLRHDEDDLEQDESMSDQQQQGEEPLLMTTRNEKIDMMIPTHSPINMQIVNNNNTTFTTTPNSAGSVTVVIPFLEEMEQESNTAIATDNVDNSNMHDGSDNSTIIEDGMDCKSIIPVDYLNSVSNIPEHYLPTDILQQEQNDFVETNNVVENFLKDQTAVTPLIEVADQPVVVKVLVFEEDDPTTTTTTVKQESIPQLLSDEKPVVEIISSINLDEDLELINDFLMSEKGADICAQQSKENSPEDSMSNQSMNDDSHWNANHQNQHHHDHDTSHHQFLPQNYTPFTPQLSNLRNVNSVLCSSSSGKGIPLEQLLNNYDHRIEYSTLESIVQQLKNIGVHTVNYLPLISKKKIMLIPGMNDKLYENLMDSAQSLDPSQSYGFSTASQCLTEFQTKRFKITTGCSALDDLFGGGIESSSVTELFGESGCGKTQICFNLCVTAQLPITIENGSDGKVLFVDTMGTFSPSRIKDMAEKYSHNNDERVITLILNNVLRERIFTSEQLFSNLNRMTTLLKTNKGKPFKLIIIDSAVSLFRSEYKGKDEIGIRQQQLGKYLDSLNKLSELYNIPIVITNQVMDSFESEQSRLYSPYSRKSSETSTKPVGGHIMAHAIATRVQLSREQRNEKRSARIFKSSTRPEGTCNFKIQATGIVDYESFD